MGEEGILIVLSGPSGAGKGTVCRKLLEDNPHLHYSISATTRPPRFDEVNGVNYWFVSEDEFLELLEKDQLLEWAKVYGNYYGTPRKYVEEKLEEGFDVVLEIDIQGAMKIKEKFSQDKCVFIYIIPPSFAELSDRIQKRGTDTPQEVGKRLSCFCEELSYINNYQYLIVNDEVSAVVQKIQAIITAEKCVVGRNKSLLRKLL